MKKEYNPVEIEMIRFDSEDIITTSGGDEKKTQLLRKNLMTATVSSIPEL